MPRITKAQKEAAFKFMLYVHDHHRASFDHLVRFEVPDDNLARLGDDTTGKKHPIFPRSVRVSSGQILALAQAKHVAAWKNDMAWMAYSLRDQARAAANGERKDLSRQWALTIAETVLVRCAEEKTPKVLLGYASIQAACRAATGYQPENYADLHRLLDRLVDRGAPFKVEHGKKGGFRRATRFTIQLPTHTDAISRAADADRGEVQDWVTEYVYGLMAALEAEQVARETLVARKSAYAATAGGLLPEMDEWIRENAVRHGRSYRVPFPGDREGVLVGVEGAGPKAGTPLVMEDSTPSDLQLKKFSAPNTPLAVGIPAARRAPAPQRWYERRRQLELAGASEAEILLDGLDLTIPESEKPRRRTWAETRNEKQAESLDRLRQRLDARGIRW